MSLALFSLAPTLTLSLASSSPDVSALQYTPIDLSRMVALKTLILYFDTSEPANDDWDPLWCFNNLLRSASSTFQRLDSIGVMVELYGREYNPYHIRYWHEASEVLLTPSRFPHLRELTICAVDNEYDNAQAFIALLDTSESMEKLRARPGLEVFTISSK